MVSGFTITFVIVVSIYPYFFTESYYDYMTANLYSAGDIMTIFCISSTVALVGFLAGDAVSKKKSSLNGKHKGY